MRSFILGPLASSCIVLGCGKSEPASGPTPAPPSAPAPTEPSPTPTEPSPTPTPTEPSPTPTPTPEPAPTPTPEPTTCRSSHVTVLDQAGTPVGDYLAAVKHALGVDLADDAAAKAALAETYFVYLDSPDVLATHIEKGVDNPKTNLYVRGESGFAVFTDFHAKLAEHLDVKAAPTADGRYLVVSVAEEFHARVPACLDGEVDEEDCEVTATGDAGGAFAHYIIDRGAQKVLFSFAYGRDEDDTCDKGAAPSLADGKWSATDCAGAAETFALADVAPCTRAFQEKRALDEAAAQREKEAAALAAAEAKRRPDAEVDAAINEGRKLTTDKKLDEAIAAFDRVIDTNPDAIRAHSGRAYALLLRAQGGDLEAAEAGFATAYQRTKATTERDDKLRSQIMFNRGLVAEKRGDAELAKRFFQKAHDLSPSDATKKKLGE